MPINQKVIFWIIVLSLVGGLAFIARRPDVSPFSKSSGLWTSIILTEDGFNPKNSTVAKGTTVRFSTDRGKPFWPASDLHPTHELYPEFDPKEPIEPDKTWSFRFDRVGEWHYHDHLFPYYRGTVNVEK